MKISVLQQKPRFRYNPLEEAPDLDFLIEQADLTLEDTYAMLDEAGRRGSDLAITVEAINMHLHCFDMRYPFPEVYETLDGPTVQRFSKKAKQWKMHIVAGLQLTIDKKTYNCAILFDDHGEIIGIHKKVHLPAGEELQITPGDRYEVFDTALGKIGMLVCWDMQFPEAARIVALSGAELIALPTLGWENIYGLCRAYENSITVATAMGVTQNGIANGCDPSCIVDHMGRILAVAGREDSQIVTCDVDIHAEPPAQYGSEELIRSSGMRETRFRQRRSDTYGLLAAANANTPLADRYKGSQG